jgi:excisionase family DNA binding protein
MEVTMNGEEVYTTGQVAKLCSVAPRTVAKWVDSGELKGYRLPGSQDRRIPVKELERFLESHSMTAQRAAILKRVVVIGCEDLSIRDALQGIEGIELSWFRGLLDGAAVIPTGPQLIILMIQGREEIAAATLIKQAFGLTIPVIGVAGTDDLAREFVALGFAQVKLTSSKNVAEDLANVVVAQMVQHGKDS